LGYTIFNIHRAAFIEDAWTPGGKLTAIVTNSVVIYGSCLDDWNIHVTD